MAAIWVLSDLLISQTRLKWITLHSRVFKSAHTYLEHIPRSEYTGPNENINYEIVCRAARDSGSNWSLRCTAACSFDILNNPTRKKDCYYLLYTWESRGTKRFNSLHKVTRPAWGRAQQRGCSSFSGSAIVLYPDTNCPLFWWCPVLLFLALLYLFINRWKCLLVIGGNEFQRRINLLLFYSDRSWVCPHVLSSRL